MSFLGKSLRDQKEVRHERDMKEKRRHKTQENRGYNAGEN